MLREVEVIKAQLRRNYVTTFEGDAWQVSGLFLDVRDRDVAHRKLVAQLGAVGRVGEINRTHLHRHPVPLSEPVGQSSQHITTSDYSAQLATFIQNDHSLMTIYLRISPGNELRELSNRHIGGERGRLGIHRLKNSYLLLHVGFVILMDTQSTTFQFFGHDGSRHEQHS